MIDDSRRCIAIDEELVELTDELIDAAVHLGNYDRVHFDRGIPAFIGPVRRRCAFVANVDDELCEKHRLYMEIGKTFLVG